MCGAANMQYDPNLFYGTHIYRFTSLEEMMEEGAKAFATTSYNPWGRYRRQRMQDSEYTGRTIHNIEHAIKLSREPWAEGLERADLLKALVRNHEFEQPMNIRRVPAWSEDHGDEVDIDRLRSGQQFWRTTERAKRYGSVNKSVVISLTMPMTFNHEMMTWRGVAVTVLTELLEQAGYRVNLYSIAYSTKVYEDKDSACLVTTLKESQDPLDVSTLINATSGWFYRAVSMSSYSVRGVNYMQQKGPFGGVATPIGYSGKTIVNDKDAVICDHVIDLASAVVWITSSMKELTTPKPPPVLVREVTAAPVQAPKPLTKKERREQERQWEQWRKDAEKAQKVWEANNQE